MDYNAVCVVSRIVQVWGHCNRLLLLGFCQSLLTDKRKYISTLSFFIATAAKGIVWQKRQKVMLKKFYFLIVAFVLGAILSLSFQACADDYEKPQVNTGGCNCGDNDKCHCGSQSGNGNNNGCNCDWGVQPLQYDECYDENGQVYYRVDYSYDNKGRMTKQIIISYTKSQAGKRHMSYKRIYDYTYSPSGDTQYTTMSNTSYKEDGSSYNSYVWTEKRVLYKK